MNNTQGSRLVSKYVTIFSHIRSSVHLKKSLEQRIQRRGGILVYQKEHEDAWDWWEGVMVT